MIVRTPPPKKQRSDVTSLPDSSLAGASDLPLVIYEDPLPLVPATTQPGLSHEPSEHMLCTYQCRQMVKSDFLDALSNAEKQVHDYELKLGVLNENLSKVESERKKFLDRLLYTEQELAAARGREKVLQEQLIKEINDAGERLKKQMQISSELEEMTEVASFLSLIESFDFRLGRRDVRVWSPNSLEGFSCGGKPRSPSLGVSVCKICLEQFLVGV